MKNNQKGFTLIELVLIIVILSVIASVAMRNMTSSISTAQIENTKKELDQLAYAIAGNPHLYSNGSRTDFGYVGDVGALPPNLDALFQNPGGYSTWDGPYITNGSENSSYKKDAWGVNYSMLSVSIRSTGSGSNIDKEFAVNSASLLSNSLYGYLTDANGQTPGSIYKDSILFRLQYPNGSGGYTNSLVFPDASGNFSFSSVPIGVHTLSLIYLPQSDTLTYSITILPSSSPKLSFAFPADIF